MSTLTSRISDECSGQSECVDVGDDRWWCDLAGRRILDRMVLS